MSSQPVKPLNLPGVPSKQDRRAAFLAKASREGLSSEEAVDAARLIPKEMVKEFKVKYWPR